MKYSELECAECDGKMQVYFDTDFHIVADVICYWCYMNKRFGKETDGKELEQ